MNLCISMGLASGHEPGHAMFYFTTAITAVDSIIFRPSGIIEYVCELKKKEKKYNVSR